MADEARTLTPFSFLEGDITSAIADFSPRPDRLAALPDAEPEPEELEAISKQDLDDPDQLALFPIEDIQRADEASRIAQQQAVDPVVEPESQSPTDSGNDSVTEDVTKGKAAPA